MENLEFGWTKSSRSNTYHYIRNFSHKANYETVTSLCCKTSIEVGYGRTKSFLEEFEIETQYNICDICKIKLEQTKLNNLKKQILNKTTCLSISDTHVLKKVICSEPGCKESGATFVSIANEEKPHYCLKHNLRVAEIIKKEKEQIA